MKLARIGKNYLFISRFLKDVNGYGSKCSGTHCNIVAINHDRILSDL